MKNPRTSHTKIFLRFALLTSPWAAFAFLVTFPWIYVTAPVYFLTLWLFWQFAHCFSNLFTRILDPEGYRQLKEAGADPFYDSLGAPLNFDSDEVRLHGTQANVQCGGCQAALFVDDEHNMCPFCGAVLQNGQWYLQSDSDSEIDLFS